MAFDHKGATVVAARHIAVIIELNIGALVVLVALGAANECREIHGVGYLVQDTGDQRPLHHRMGRWFSSSHKLGKARGS